SLFYNFWIILHEGSHNGMATLVYVLLSLLTASYVQLTLARDECYGPIVELTLLSAATARTQPRVLVKHGVLAGIGSNLSQPIRDLHITAAEPLTACGAVAPVAAGTALLVIRGNCTFTEKALAVQAAGAAAMLLYDNEPGCITMAFEPNITNSTSPSLAVISVPHDTGLELMGLLAAADAASMTLSFRLLDVSLVDSSAVILWLLAVGTVAAGAIWSGVDHLAAHRAAMEEQDPLLRGGTSKPKGSGIAETMDLTPYAALGFVVVASGMLLLLYFFLNRVFFFVLLGLFCVASVQSQTVLYSAGLQAMLPRPHRHATIAVPLVGLCPLTVVLALPVAVAVAVVWAIQRNASWAWVLQDAQGVALMVLVLRSLRIPCLKVAAVLLPACLAYDVFWVFLQPLLFGGGESVMVEVAQGGSSGEYVPMLLRVPHFGLGGLGGFSLLGFGDVILPGMLVAYTRRLDLDLGASFSQLSGPVSYLSRAYFPYTLLSYGAGLCLTYAALAFSWFGDQGQPALLYLVPCTLLTVVGLAAARRQMAVLWKGETHGSMCRAATDHESDPGDAGGPPSPPASMAGLPSRQAGAGTGTGVSPVVHCGDDVEVGCISGGGAPRQAHGGVAGFGLRLVEKESSSSGMAVHGHAAGGGGSSSNTSSSIHNGSGGGRVGGAARRVEAAERARLLQQ
ncbi:hypothetical protein Vretifemale_7712, partial [Volvox reticuliferus]